MGKVRSYLEKPQLGTQAPSLDPSGKWGHTRQRQALRLATDSALAESWESLHFFLKCFHSITWPEDIPLEETGNPSWYLHPPVCKSPSSRLQFESY